MHSNGHEPQATPLWEGFPWPVSLWRVARPRGVSRGDDRPSPSPLPTRQKWGFLPLLNSPEDFPRLLKRRYQSGDPQCWGLLNVLIGWGSWPRQRSRNPGRVCPVLVPGLQPRQWSQPGWRWVVGTGLRQVLKLPGWCNLQWGLRTSFRLSVWSPRRPLHPTSTVTRENGGGWRCGDWHPFSSLSVALLFCSVWFCLPPASRLL